jgi:hypothetical protein
MFRNVNPREADGMRIRAVHARRVRARAAAAMALMKRKQDLRSKFPRRLKALKFPAPVRAHTFRIVG